MEHAEILHRCFRCGYCKFPSDYTDLNCPAYLKFRFETYSPGGRMWLLRGWLAGELEATPRFQEILFSCATCGNCVAHCAFPEFRDRLLDAFTAGKEALVEAGSVPSSVRDYLTRLQSHGNPYKMSAAKRDAWADGLDLPLYAGQDFLLFIDDVCAYDSRGQAMARSVASLLKRMGVSFGLLGSREISDGNEARAMGETDLFRHLAEKNIEALKDVKAQKIICLSPHSYHALKNHYPEFGGTFQVFHYTQAVALFLAKAGFKSDVPDLKITYHDPCYLGRHNKDYWTARSIFSQMPGIEFREMDRNQQSALCCGGGGGNFFTDLLGGSADSPARVRVREAADTGAQILAVACPQCAVMLEDAAKTEGLEGKLEVKEISEIVGPRIK